MAFTSVHPHFTRLLRRSGALSYRCSAERVACGMVVFLLVLIQSTGCAVKSQRGATEQLLLSDAVDQAIGGIDFSVLAGKSVFLDTSYITRANGPNIINSDYVISSIRHQLTAASCMIQPKREDAEIVVEPRVGTLGTDGNEIIYGIPASDLGKAMTAASASPVSLGLLPEVSLGRRHSQHAVAKVIVYAYDQQTLEPIWQSGIAKAESTSRDTWILGAGPIQKGTLYEGTRVAGKRLEGSPIDDLQRVVADEDTKRMPLKYESPRQFSSFGKPNASSEEPASEPEVQPAGHTEEGDGG